MNQKQEALIALKALFSQDSNDLVDKEYLHEKIDTCLNLAKPTVILDEEAKKKFQSISDGLRKQGKII